MSSKSSKKRNSAKPADAFAQAVDVASRAKEAGWKVDIIAIEGFGIEGFGSYEYQVIAKKLFSKQRSS